MSTMVHCRHTHCHCGYVDSEYEDSLYGSKQRWPLYTLLSYTFSSYTLHVYRLPLYLLPLFIACTVAPTMATSVQRPTCEWKQLTLIVLVFFKPSVDRHLLHFNCSLNSGCIFFFSKIGLGQFQNCCKDFYWNRLVTVKNEFKNM